MGELNFYIFDLLIFYADGNQEVAGGKISTSNINRTFHIFNLRAMES